MHKIHRIGVIFQHVEEIIFTKYKNPSQYHVGAQVNNGSMITATIDIPLDGTLPLGRSSDEDYLKRAINLSLISLVGDK